MRPDWVAGRRSRRVEQWTENPRVGGSIPPLVTTLSGRYFCQCPNHRAVVTLFWISRRAGSRERTRQSRTARTYTPLATNLEPARRNRCRLSSGPRVRPWT